MTTTTETPAAQLRAAAKLMRERAEKASTRERWESEKHYDSLYLVDMKPSLGPVDLDEPTDNSLGTDGAQPFENPRIFMAGHEQAEYIASMHPGVALAVADWLEAEADRAAEIDGFEDSAAYPLMLAGFRHSLAVARAYLGEPDE